MRNRIPLGQQKKKKKRLNLKDLWGSRFNTLWDIYLNHENTHDPQDWVHVNDILLAGDRGVSAFGNRYYDVLKFLEPYCIYCINERATVKRPLLKITQQFHNFVQTTLKSFQEDGLHVTIFDLISRLRRTQTVIEVYGMYRLWGHPYIEYLEGLKELHEQVNMLKDIDIKYAEALGSDLKRIILHHKFKTEKKWFVKVDKVRKDHPLFPFIENDIWPDETTIDYLGDIWYELPLIKCWEVPSVFDPSSIYSDKSHSPTRSEFLNHLRNHPGKPIPSHRVLETLLTTESINVPEFLARINEHGLDDDSLIIGLRAKEREMKRKGRFFSLMSWDLRNYFVITEYLLKVFVIPLFHGLTMADDMNSLLKKMLDNSIGHGSNDYDLVTVANHLDYTKWNNHQRYESTYPAFRVLGEAVGYEFLYTRTHEFFQKSWIYYGVRADLLSVFLDKVVNSDPDKMVFWEGQLGGLEGLRQKGWTILNYLVILRESRIRNTVVKILAQGDNQVICTKYKKRNTRDNDELKSEVDGILSNNNSIMKAVLRATERLGLIINPEETLQSADLLVYGKIIIYRGLLIPVRSKRYARILCTTNDRTPSLATSISSCVSCCLAVSYYSESPKAAIATYTRTVNFIRLLLERHDPAIRCPLFKVIPHQFLSDEKYWILLAFLDPSLGGISGVNLNRFFIRGFPDPVTESLSFWNIILCHSTTRNIKISASIALTPKLAKVSALSFRQLLEDPLSLNIMHGISADTLIKEKIKILLQRNSHRVVNRIVRDALEFHRDFEPSFIEFLNSISPLFPRFLSEFYSSTFLGITQSVVSLFQNSRTLKSKFSKSMGKEVNYAIVLSELISLKRIFSRLNERTSVDAICSSFLADSLRLASWGRTVLGATVPHPCELFTSPMHFPDCSECQRSIEITPYISLLVPKGIQPDIEERGPFRAYLGSRTKESTGVLQPWEHETKVPLIERASRLRRAIGWFIKKGSILEGAILSNLRSLTGEDFSSILEGSLRTGSALHRFSSSRQAAGGYISSSPTRASYMMATTDTLHTLGNKNFDFIFQTALLFQQQLVGEYCVQSGEKNLFHSHILCINCIREVEDIWLDATFTFPLPGVSDILSKWKPSDVPWITSNPVIPVRKVEWNSLNKYQQQLSLAWVQTHILLTLQHESSDLFGEELLFPIVIRAKLDPRVFIQGVAYGLLTASALILLQTRSFIHSTDPTTIWKGLIYQLIDHIVSNDAILNIIRFHTFHTYLLSLPLKIPPSFPSRNLDLGYSLKECLLLNLRRNFQSNTFSPPNSVPIFSDLYHSKIVLSLTVARKVTQLLLNRKFTKKVRESIKIYKSLWKRLSDETLDDILHFLAQEPVVLLPNELRHATREMEDFNFSPNDLNPVFFDNQVVFPVTVEELPFSVFKQNSFVDLGMPRPHRDPLISGLRTVQWATGSHYKMYSILKTLSIKPKAVLSAGDGSGGISSLILRQFPGARVFFNSLIDFSGINLKGTAPAPPSAVVALDNLKGNCINYDTCWSRPSDLSCETFWEYFREESSQKRVSYDLWIFDMECSTVETIKKILSLIIKNVGQWLNVCGSLIFKTYLPLLLILEDELIQLSKSFQKVFLTTTLVTSSHSAETYLVFHCRSSVLLGFAHIDWRKLSQITRSWPNRRIQSQEFQRAFELKKYNFEQGFPPNRIPDLWTQLIETIMLLMRHGPESHKLSNMLLILDKTAEVNKVWAIFAYGYFHLVRSHLHSSVSIHLPDGSVEAIGIWLVGWLKWISWISENEAVCRLSQQILDSFFPFHYEGSVDKRIFNVSIHEKLMFLKKVHVDQHSSTIGTLIRILRRITEKVTGILRLDHVLFQLGLLEDRVKSSQIFDQLNFYNLIQATSINTTFCSSGPKKRNMGPPEALVD